MKRKFSFSIESLLYNTEELKGPLVQVMFAKKIAEHFGAFNFDTLARVNFGNPDTHKAFPTLEKLEETLLTGQFRHRTGDLHLCIRGTRSACLVASGYLSNRKVTIYNDYRNIIIPVKLSDSEIKQIFTHVRDNPDELLPIGPPFPDFD